MKLIQKLFWILVSLLVSTTSLEAQTNVSEPMVHALFFILKNAL